MIRPLTLLSLFAAAGAGLYLYQVKHDVAGLEKQLLEIRHNTEAARERTRVLRAEWAWLNEPDRLRQLAGRVLSLEPMQPTQFTRSSEMTRRLPQAVAFAGAPSLFGPEPGTTVAAAEPAGTAVMTAAQPAPVVAAPVATSVVAPMVAPVAAPVVTAQAAPAPVALAAAVPAPRLAPAAPVTLASLRTPEPREARAEARPEPRGEVRAETSRSEPRQDTRPRLLASIEPRQPVHRSLPHLVQAAEAATPNNPGSSVSPRREPFGLVPGSALPPATLRPAVQMRRVPEHAPSSPAIMGARTEAAVLAGNGSLLGNSQPMLPPPVPYGASAAR